VEIAMSELPEKQRRVSEAIRRIRRTATSIANERNVRPLWIPKDKTLADYHSRHKKKRVSTKPIDQF
jgi:hypothetical protein